MAPTRRTNTQRSASKGPNAASSLRYPIQERPSEASEFVGGGHPTWPSAGKRPPVHEHWPRKERAAFDRGCLIQAPATGIGARTYFYAPMTTSFDLNRAGRERPTLMIPRTYRDLEFTVDDRGHESPVGQPLTPHMTWGQLSTENGSGRAYISDWPECGST